MKEEYIKNQIIKYTSIAIVIFVILTTTLYVQGQESDVDYEKFQVNVEPIPDKSVKETSEVDKEIDKEIVEAELKNIQMLKDKEQIDQIEDRKEWFLAYKKFCEKYADLGVPDTVYDFFSEEDILLMQKTIETECYQADFNSKCNVASVILNRYENIKFPGTVKEVVESGFAYGRDVITEDTKLALEYAFEIEDTTDGCLYFHSNEWSAEFNKAKYIFTDDVGHHFYR